MKTKYISLKSFLLIFFFFGFFVQQTLAQTCNDLSISAVTTESTCSSNGTIFIDVKSNFVGSSINSIKYDVRNSSGVSVTGGAGGFVESSTIYTLSGGTYSVYVQVLFNNGVKLECSMDSPVTVSSSYIIPTLSFTPIRQKTLNCIPTGSVRIFIKDGKGPYTASFVSYPSTYSGQTQFTNINKGSEFIVDNLPAGEYRLRVSDECYTLPEQTLTISAVASDYPASNFYTGFSPTGSCGSLRVSYQSANANASELSPYFSVASDRAKYYEYAWQTPAQTAAGTPKVWQSVPSSNLDYSPQAGITYKDMLDDINKRPLLYFRIKNGNGCEQTTGQSFIMTRPAIRETISSACGAISYSYGLTSSGFYCTPWTWSLTGNKGYSKSGSSSSNTALVTQSDLDPAETYSLTITTFDGQIFNKLNFTLPTPTVVVPTITSSSGASCSSTEGQAHISIVRSGSLVGSIITFVSAPSGYVALTGMMAVGESRTVLPTHTATTYYPFSPDTGTGNTSAIFRTIPPGVYIFKVIDPCGVERTLTRTVSINYPYVYQDVEPVYDYDICGRVRVYPFRNIKNWLARNGVNTQVFLHVTGFPSGLSINDVTFSGSTKYLASTTSNNNNNVANQNAYFEIPKTTGTFTLTLSYSSSATVNCKQVQSINMDNLALTYDPETYYAYRCGGAVNGVIGLEAINSIGPFNYELLDFSGSLKIAEVLSVPKGEIAVFEDLGTSGSRFFKVRITDLTCNESVIKDIQVNDLSSPGILGTTSGSFKFCVGDPVTLKIINLGVHQESYVWTFPDGSQHSGRFVSIPSATAANTGIYHIKVSSLLCENNVTTFEGDMKVSVAPLEMWWKTDALDSNWHNMDNWNDADGNTVKAVPAACTVVHIPGSVNQYFPELDPLYTLQDEYGQPECDKIYYHYGSETGSPYLLKYNKAFVQYNWGYYENGTLKVNEDTRHPGADILALERERWYMLAAPLKNMASGDFGLAGYPRTWQMLFNTTNPQTGVLTPGAFTTPFNTLNVNLGSVRNALSVSVAGYQDRLGFKDHKYLNGLKGILEMPYFENSIVAPYRPLHSYVAGASLFTYYSQSTLQPLGKTDKMNRGAETNRFIFENAENQIPSILSGPTLIKGYTLSLGSASGEIMIGNPFMTTMDFDKFYQANNMVIEETSRTFINNTWVEYNVSTGGVTGGSRYIAPLQSFTVKLKGLVSSLLFPVEGDNDVLAIHSYASPSLRSFTDEESEDKSSTFYVEVENGISKTRAAISWDFPGHSNVIKMVNPDYSNVPQVFFTDTEGMLNAIQFESSNRPSITMGVSSSVFGRMTLRFGNIVPSSFDRCELLDKRTGISQDLLLNNQYDFTHSVLNDPARFALTVIKKGLLTSVNQDQRSAFNISVENKILKIDSSDQILSVRLFDLAGRAILSDNVEDNQYQKALLFTPGIYIVKVIRTSGDVKVEKIIIK